MIRYFVIAEETCPNCNGEKWIHWPHCRECNTDIPSCDVDDESGVLLCGHPIEAHVEEEPCTECEGTGKVRHEVDLIETLIKIGAASRDGRWTYR